MFCTKCGKELRDGVRFCTACGSEVRQRNSVEVVHPIDLDKLSADECRLARNEIYARHGRRFLDETVQAYFDSQDWYEGTIDADDFSESVLNEYERKNADMILEYENKKGYR